MAGEFELIDRLRQQVQSHPNLRLGIGDDAAEVLFGKNKTPVLVTVDMLMDQVHFDLANTDPRLIGRKALAVNLSDIAAMGGEAIAIVVSYALPKGAGDHGTGDQLAEQLHQGIVELAEQHQVAVAGGDTNSWKGPLVISITALGQPVGPKAIERSGARVGDLIFVTGELGGSLAGRHLTFTPRLKEARELVNNYDVHAMIDLSDGISSDLQHILRESEVGAVLHAEQIPIHSDARRSSGDRSPLEHALHDGEDFEVLFTVSPEDAVRLTSHPLLTGTRVTQIGEITAGSEPFLIDQGERRLLTRSGWEHSL
ncbi:Thiamine-monophosphate kinase [Polystyrenella longa]|uniref:Thiamine-monophosphate kinase n=1 Tax=Polystyrenella longa TaxID=2528007 RepID=A0A518CT42_9PLAN|nr:thiamine-phosphate kinase [Polystyrenella longa]QDU82398.1 Thiamine-monophosphate kinase [Polystyrenella longa]